MIRSIRLTRPIIAGAKMADGRWDLGALIKRDTSERNRSGPNRPIHIQSIEVVDGRISLQDPLDFGAAHVPTDFQQLNALFSFAYVPVHWTLDFSRVSWTGHAPDLSVTLLSGRFGLGPKGWFFEQLRRPHRAVGLRARRHDRHGDEADDAEPTGARGALRLSGVVRRAART